MSINRCDICYHYVASSCSDIIAIPDTGLDTQNIYSIIIEDGNGSIILKNDISLGGGGGYQISLSEWPNGMFNQWSGSYEIWFTDGGIDGNQQTLTIGGKEYPCILMTFKDVTIA